VFAVAILTNEPNDLTRPAHDQMLVVLKPGGEGARPDPELHDSDQVMALCPYPADLIAADPAKPALNRPSFEGPDYLVSGGWCHRVVRAAHPPPTTPGYSPGPTLSGGARVELPLDPAFYPGRRSRNPGLRPPAAPRARRTCGLDPAALRAPLKDDSASVRLTAACLLTE
jgi:hypothetical protein